MNHLFISHGNRQIGFENITPIQPRGGCKRGPVDSQNRMSQCCYESMEMAGRGEDGAYEYRREIRCERSGRYGFTTRVTAAGKDWKTSMPGFLTWAETP